MSDTQIADAGHSEANEVVAKGKAVPTQDDILTINHRIDDITAFQKKSGPWYRDTGLLISAAAFSISIVTSGLAAYRTYRQDINARKDALQSLIQQYYSSAINNVGMQYSFEKDVTGPSDPHYGLVQYFSGAANGAVVNVNAMLSKKSLSLVQELGTNASSIDLSEVAYMLTNSSLYTPAVQMYKESIRRAENSVEFLGGTRGLAQIQYTLGKQDDSTNSMNQALGVFALFPDEAVKDYLNWTQFQTYTFWIGFVGVNDCKLSKDNLALAIHFAELLPSSYSANAQTQISSIKTNLAACV
jgi:hypothetical protein